MWAFGRALSRHAEITIRVSRLAHGVRVAQFARSNFVLGASSAGEKERSDFIFLVIDQQVFVSASICLELVFHFCSRCDGAMFGSAIAYICLIGAETHCCDQCMRSPRRVKEGMTIGGVEVDPSYELSATSAQINVIPQSAQIAVY